MSHYTGTIGADERAKIADLFRNGDADAMGAWLYTAQHSDDVRRALLADPALANVLADYCERVAEMQAAGGPKFYESAADYAKRAETWRVAAAAKATP